LIERFLVSPVLGVQCPAQAGPEPDGCKSEQTERPKSNAQRDRSWQTGCSKSTCCALLPTSVSRRCYRKARNAVTRVLEVRDVTFNLSELVVKDLQRFNLLLTRGTEPAKGHFARNVLVNH
jgi:hypothetical protein